jgi:AraC-like DNA-binding protein
VGAILPHRIAPSARLGSALAALSVLQCDQGGPAVWIPRPEVHLVVRFGPSTRSGVDVHAFGVLPNVRRKQLHGGQRTVTARLQLTAPGAVLGVPGSAIAGRVVALEDLWGDAATRQLCARLLDAPDMAAAAASLENAIAERAARAKRRHSHAELAVAASERLAYASVHAVAAELGVSERQLRRAFQETVGLSPKAFANLRRFRRALYAACDDAHASWAEVAAAAGYYDQAHLIAEFRAIAGVTPRELLSELRTAASLG